MNRFAVALQSTVADKRRRHPVLIAAFSMGYGPAAKALVLATACREAGLESVFVGRGVAYELISRNQGDFVNVVEASAADAVAYELVRDARAVVSVMDRDMAQLAIQASRPLHIVDSLLWMRDSIPDAFRSARRYWAQQFPGHEPAAYPHIRPCFVGPILGVSPAPRQTPRNLVVNLGGFESAVGSGRDRRYAELIVRAIAASGVADAYPGQVRILASATVTDILRPFATEMGVEPASLSHADTLAQLASAHVVATTPGLTTTLECFSLGRPTVFLPPRNFSQWCVLKTLRAHGVAPHALHWEDLDDAVELGDRLPERVRNPRVQAAIDELAVTAAAHDAMVRVFTAAADDGHAGLRADQHAFLSSLGTPGSRVIAEDLATDGV